MERYGVDDTYVRSKEISSEIKGETPPNGAKDVACDLTHAMH